MAQPVKEVEVPKVVPQPVVLSKPIEPKLPWWKDWDTSGKVLAACVILAVIWVGFGMVRGARAWEYTNNNFRVLAIECNGENCVITSTPMNKGCDGKITLPAKSMEGVEVGDVIYIQVRENMLAREILSVEVMHE